MIVVAGNVIVTVIVSEVAVAEELNTAKTNTCEDEGVARGRVAFERRPVVADNVVWVALAPVQH